MLNPLRFITTRTIFSSILITSVSMFSAVPVWSQVSPEIWGTVGTIDDSVSYGAGARLGRTGIEIGTGEEGATGADFLTFIGLPFVSPYLGLGYYSGDEAIAYSGGVHVNVASVLVIGGGYHSVRGPNGQLGLGLKF